MVLQERKSAMTAISPITSISQGHLNIWEICRRRYQYSFLEELSLPEADLQRKKNLLLGSNFHLLMQQKELGLDVSSLASSDPKLRSWIDAFEHQPPEMIKGDRLCEHRRTLEMQIEMSLNHSENGDHGQAYFVLTAIYDFLILGDRKAQILDWKTHQVAIAAEKLKTNWQTRLYLSESVIISYSQIENDQTEKKLQHILGQIAQAQDYPKLASDSSECVYCEFRDRCDRGDMLSNHVSGNIADIPEVAI